MPVIANYAMYLAYQNVLIVSQSILVPFEKISTTHK